MMEEIVYKKIEAYLSGNMSAEEAKQFELEIASQPELKEEVALYKSINHHLTETSYDDDSLSNTAYKKEIESYIQSDEGEAIKKKLLKVKEDYKATSEKGKPKIRSLYYILSAAAAVILLFGLFFTGNSNESLYSDYYKVSDLPSFTNRSDQASLLSKASTAFKEGDLDTSLNTFQEYIATGKEVDPLVYVYTGLIYSEKENLEKAVEQFDFLENAQGLDRSRALWYKALAYLKFDKVAEAKIMLTSILEDPFNYNYKEAKELLEKL
jgi:hypothetical protein